MQYHACISMFLVLCWKWIKNLLLSGIWYDYPVHFMSYIMRQVQSVDVP